jgi:hypothetical protein
MHADYAIAAEWGISKETKKHRADGRISSTEAPFGRSAAKEFAVSDPWMRFLRS